MSTTVPPCPHCDSVVSANDEFCPSCNAWLAGGATWPAPPKPMPLQPSSKSGNDHENLEPVPLVIPDPTPIMRRLALIRIGLFALTLLLAAVWILAERMIVTRHSWPGWDYTWLVAAALTSLAAVWWLLDLIQRGRSNGWNRWWRFWEQPGDKLVLF